MKKYSFTVYYQHEDDTIETKVFEFDSQEKCVEALTMCQRVNFNDPRVYFEGITEKCCSDENISWDEYFMNMALLTAKRSKDTTKVGAVITKDHKVLGCGYNGFVKSINESLFPTAREADSIENTKYPYVIHAEANAILNTTVFDITGSTVYVSLFPCCECCKLLLQKGISEVVYLSDKYHDKPEYIASRKMFDVMNVKTRRFEGNIIV